MHTKFCEHPQNTLKKLADNIYKSMYIYGMDNVNDKKLHEHYPGNVRDKLYMGMIYESDFIILSNSKMLGACHSYKENEQMVDKKTDIDLPLSEVESISLNEEDKPYLVVNQKYYIKLNPLDNKARIMRIFIYLTNSIRLHQESVHKNQRMNQIHWLHDLHINDLYNEVDHQALFEYNGTFLSESYGKEMTKPLFEAIRAAEFEMGYHYLIAVGDRRNETEAVKWVKKAARRQLPEGQNLLGYCYLFGQGVGTNCDKALELYREAANNHHSNAQYNLGTYTINNPDASEEEKEEAFRWFEKAAVQGHPIAQNNLATCYYYGKGTKQDLSNAAMWYAKAAYNENAIAQYNLANMYHYGNGVNQNEAMAELWYRRAAENGIKEAEKLIGEVQHNEIYE